MRSLASARISWLLEGASGELESNGGVGGKVDAAEGKTLLWGQADISKERVVFQYKTDQREYRITWTIDDKNSI